jgi:lysophospholipase L1-like esterase
MIGRIALLSSFLLAAACSSDSSGGDSEPAAADAAIDTLAQCAPTPGRLIVLGDSIAACAGVAGKEGATCGPKIFHSSLASGYAPGVVYQNHAVSGAVTTNVADVQLSSVATGPGHVLVLVYVGGNDMQRYLTQADAAAEAGLRGDLPGIAEDWQSVFAFFNDTSNFPDGATIIMNNQYNPFDDCTAPPYNLSATKSGLLGEFNAKLASLANEFDNVVITDQHTPYLGHGHHYSVASCPHYQAGLEPFMNDLIHPNAAGHANLAVQWNLVADGLYGDCE